MFQAFRSWGQRRTPLSERVEQAILEYEFLSSFLNLQPWMANTVYVLGLLKVECYKAFSFTWPTAMTIYYNKRNRFNFHRTSLDWGSGCQHGRRFIVLAHQYGGRDFT